MTILCNVCGAPQRHITALVEHFQQHQRPRESFEEVVARIQREEQAEAKNYRALLHTEQDRLGRWLT